MIDIGANKGFFSKLSLECGVQEVVAIDLDEYSLDKLREEAKNDKLNIWTVNIDLMNYSENINHYARYGVFPPLFKRINADFCICFALVHHVCYFNSYIFEEFAERIYKFCNKILLIEFVHYTDIHLSGPIYEGNDKSWYTQENFIVAMKKYFPKKTEIFQSTPQTRTLIKFER